MTIRTNTAMGTDATGLDMQRSCEGYDVHAVDGDIGKVSDASNEAGRNSLVVDTGTWIFGKKRMIPAACVRSVDHTNRRIDVSLTKSQIKDAPDAKERTSWNDSYYDEQAQYSRSWL